jgi:hypothetical protein
VTEECTYLEVIGFDLTLEAAQEACAIWEAYEPGRRYFRIQASNAVAVLDIDHGDRFFFDKEGGSETALEVGSRPSTPWEARLEELIDAA